MGSVLSGPSQVAPTLHLSLCSYLHVAAGYNDDNVHGYYDARHDGDEDGDDESDDGDADDYEL